MGKRYSNEIRNQAIALRKAGYSYSLIKEQLNISKATLSVWLGEIPFHPNKLVKIRQLAGPLRSAATLRLRRKARENYANALAKEAVDAMTQRDLFMLGLGIYMGEGSKTGDQVRVANSDPRIISLMVKWFHQCLKVPLSHIKIEMHLYADCDEKACQKFWTSVTGIPSFQFNKTIYDLREKIKSARTKRVSSRGTVQIQIRANGKPLFGTHLHRFIMASVQETIRHAGIV